jgi:hypothetical protein
MAIAEDAWAIVRGSRLTLALVSLVAAAGAAGFLLSSIAHGIAYGDMYGAPGITLQELAHEQGQAGQARLGALCALACNVILVWLWLPKTWSPAATSATYRMCASLIIPAVETAVMTAAVLIAFSYS